MNIVQKMLAGFELEPYELAQLAYGDLIDPMDSKHYQFIDEYEGEDHRWTRRITTIFTFIDFNFLPDDVYWAIKWDKGLIEKDMFENQPFKVKCIEKIVTTHQYDPI